MQSTKTRKTRWIVSSILTLALCLTLCGCGGGSSDDSASDTANTGSSATSTQQSTASSDAEEQAPITTAAYLQEGTFGDDNVLAFIINQQEGEVISMRIFYGSVEVSGNSTTKRNYTMSTTTVEDPSLETFAASFSSGEGSVLGSIGSTSFAGTVILPGVGEFTFDAPATESKNCSSCNGTGTGIGAGASTCSSCNGVGTLISYKGTYI